MPWAQGNDKLHRSIARDDKNQPAISPGRLFSANIGVLWQGQDCRFADWRYFPAINAWRDHLPGSIGQQLPGMSSGQTLQQVFPAGELVEAWQPGQVIQLKRNQLQTGSAQGNPVQPATGRFYTRDRFVQLAGIDPGNRCPCRIIDLAAERITVDLNHPLSTREINFRLKVDRIWPDDTGRGRPCHDITSAACDHGPGMQERYADVDTDFCSDEPLSRLDEGDDKAYFTPSLVPYWDTVSLLQVTRAYNALIPTNARILDLMAGVHSPLQESSVNPVSVVGAGLNQQELDNNPVCTERRVLDVNQISALPFADESFDVVLIHAAVEYCVQPFLLFAEIGRILRPAGRVIISLSDRYEQRKAIRIWHEVHPFERVAIILHYLRSSGKFCHFQATSQRDLWHREKAENINWSTHSDAVFIIHADRCLDQK